jgi:hypothetical protein
MAVEMVRLAVVSGGASKGNCIKAITIVWGEGKDGLEDGKQY